MVLFRATAVVLALAFLLCMAAFTITGQPVWRQRAMMALKWGVGPVLLRPDHLAPRGHLHLMRHVMP